MPFNTGLTDGDKIAPKPPKKNIATPVLPPEEVKPPITEPVKPVVVEKPKEEEHIASMKDAIKNVVPYDKTTRVNKPKNYFKRTGKNYKPVL